MIYADKLMCEIQIHYVCPCPSFIPEPVQYVLELETGM